MSVLYKKIDNLSDGYEHLMLLCYFLNSTRADYHRQIKSDIESTITQLRAMNADEDRIAAIRNTNVNADMLAQEGMRYLPYIKKAAVLPVSEMQDPFWWKNLSEAHVLREFGGTAFVIDGSDEPVSRMVEIQQIIDDIVTLKCIPGGGIMIRKVGDLFKSKHDADEAIEISRRIK